MAILQRMKSGLIKSLVSDADRYLGYTARGFVNTNELGVHNIRAKVEFHEAKTNQRYVHIMFTHTNKFWARTEDLDVSNNWVVAQSNQPEEDESNPSCTMWEPFRVGSGTSTWRFRHVQSGGELCVVPGTGNAFVNLGDVAAGELSYQFSVVNRDALVQLPKLVAIRGGNGKYLKGIVIDDRNYLQFSSDDPNEAAAAHEISTSPAGYISITSSFFNQQWRRDPSDNMILGGPTRVSGILGDTLFRPIKIDRGTIILTNLGNNRVCKRHTINDRLIDLFNASDYGAVNNLTVLQFREPVLERRIINVRYRIADARIYNETVSVIGQGVAVNNSDRTNSIVVRVSYEDTSTSTFTNNVSVATRVKTTFSAGLPLIGSTPITVGTEVTTASEWGETTTRTRMAESEYIATVPPWSQVTIDYVATNGTCSVPFDYTQRDKLAEDGSFVSTQHDDGIYYGTNYYSFGFENLKIEPLRKVKEEEYPAAAVESLKI